jgi:hypothetical protein
MRLSDHLVIIFLIVLFGLVAALCCYAGPAKWGLRRNRLSQAGGDISETVRARPNPREDAAEGNSEVKPKRLHYHIV